ncbi:caspase family protein [Roseibium sediminicola]|uniref:Caspase family protein n=1 Tax=Roseibium sediminicola TaxID=2933272 RepID=A0ABT0H2Y9_9HYPH|nr:caspase family protein [Roseibium sp. CAU 1639]MCK7616053.1 caspase family protein [Roseibium sp. CAU 1639]
MLALFTLLLVLAPAQASAKRYALVIGIANYDNVTPLKNPVEDARLMAKSLKEVGFEVSLVLDTTVSGFNVEIDRFVSSVPKTSTVLVYYAGHGIQYAGENYLIASDANIESLSDLKRAGVSAQALLKKLHNTNARSLIMVLDACRNNPLDEVETANMSRAVSGLKRDSGVSLGDGLARISEGRPGTLIAFSTAPGEVAFDGEGLNSPYTYALAASIRKQGISIERVFKETRSSVVQNTSGYQVPWENSSLLESLVLLPNEGQAETERATECDLAAAHPSDPDRVGPSVDYRSLDPQRAIPACEVAVTTFPDNPRFKTLLARAYDRAGRGEDAFRMNELAMTEGYLAAWHNQGNLYAKGLGVPQNYTKAFEFFLYAAERGHPEDQHNIGVAYLLGRGVPVDHVAARQWFGRATDQNWAASINRLGLMHERGEGGDPDPLAAALLYQRATNLGDRNAMVNLANAYRYGKGIEVNQARAVDLFERSALLGTRSAFMSLAIMYAEGEGVEKDDLTAAFWYTLASREGDPEALETLLRIKSSLNERQQQELRKKIEDWDHRQFG